MGGSIGKARAILLNCPFVLEQLSYSFIFIPNFPLISKYTILLHIHTEIIVPLSLLSKDQISRCSLCSLHSHSILRL